MKRLFAVMFCLAWLAACTNTKITTETGDTSTIADTSDTAGLVPNHIVLVKSDKPPGSTTDDVDPALAIPAMQAYIDFEKGKPGAVKTSSDKVVSGLFLSKENIMTLLNEPGSKGITIRLGTPIISSAQHRPRTYAIYYYSEKDPVNLPFGDKVMIGRIKDYVPPVPGN
ncbi:hypothetical protein GZH53_12630 [Flavihumibacter sp. R14]|nr:hypothetical protein [Flavihumibacter soli]